MVPNEPSIWWRLVNLQPATWRGIVMAAFALAAALGLKFAPEIPDAAFLVVLAALPVIQGLWTKKAVTPNAKVVIRMPDPIKEPDLITAGPAVPVDVSHNRIIAAANLEGVQ